MLGIRTLGRFAIACVCLVAVTVATSDTAMARKQYMDGFKAKYPELAGKEKITCAMCHPTKSKKDRNNYGFALSKALGKPKVTDKEVIKKAIEKIASEKSATEGKTFGDLIEDGKLPGTKEVVKK